MSEQPWRRFALVLSLTNEYWELRVLFYDHASGVVSPAFNIYQQADVLVHIIAAIHFGSLECIGYDSTVSFTKHVSPPHHHTDDYRLIKNLPTRWQHADRTTTAVTSEAIMLKPLCPALPLSRYLLTWSSSPSHILALVHMSLLSIWSPPLVQVTMITSAPLLQLASQAPQEPDSIYTATPHPSQFPYSTQLPEPCGKIRVRDMIYTIKRILFASCSLVSCGTVCYLVTLDNKEFIIKDHWVQGKEDQVVLNEIDMLKRMSGVPSVPELVDWWIVETSNGDADMTIQCTAVEECKVLHRDCSLNNAMIIDLLGGGSQGFLIDWEFVVRINPDLKYVIGGMGVSGVISHEKLPTHLDT
ncbi:hypothetical protein EDB19DRAFT_1830993 [Suillus lakei]|nr:hypothetical protein EDB19DRAFT_1830993 [Suillus lakei]